MFRTARLASFIVLVSVVLISCSAHRSSVGNNPNNATIYEADEKRVFDIVYSSIQETLSSEKISVITAPTRGYIAKFLAPPFHVDWFTQKVLVHRASGINKNREKVYGYWIEVSGSGSSFLQGQLKNAEVFNTIVGHLEKTTRKHKIFNISNEPYLVPQENFYVRGADTLEGEGSRVIITNKGGKTALKDREKQLRDLHKLRVDGILTQREYDAAKRKVLSKY
jgi:hypothetical protein